MLKSFFSREKYTLIDEQIDAVLSEMQLVGVSSEEYPKLLAHLEKLNKAKTDQRPSRVNRDTMAIIAGNLFGILVIVVYEQKHVLTSKAMNQLIRPNR